MKYVIFDGPPVDSIYAVLSFMARSWRLDARRISSYKNIEGQYYFDHRSSKTRHSISARIWYRFIELTVNTNGYYISLMILNAKAAWRGNWRLSISRYWPISSSAETKISSVDADDEQMHTCLHAKLMATIVKSELDDGQDMSNISIIFPRHFEKPRAHDTAMPLASKSKHYATHSIF